MANGFEKVKLDQLPDQPDSTLTGIDLSLLPDQPQEPEQAPDSELSIPGAILERMSRPGIIEGLTGAIGGPGEALDKILNLFGVLQSAGVSFLPPGEGREDLTVPEAIAQNLTLSQTAPGEVAKDILKETVPGRAAGLVGGEEAKEAFASGVVDVAGDLPAAGLGTAVTKITGKVLSKLGTALKGVKKAKDVKRVLKDVLNDFPVEIEFAFQKDIETLARDVEAGRIGADEAANLLRQKAKTATTTAKAAPTIEAPLKSEVAPTPPPKPTDVPPPPTSKVDLGGTPKKRVPGERSFPKTLDRAGLEGGTNRTYEVYTDKAAISKAKGRIEASPEAAYNFAKSTEKPLSKDQVTTGILSLQNLNREIAETVDVVKKGVLAEREIELANVLSQRLTEAGQSIQAASIVNRLSPEGLLLFAQKRVNQINKARKTTFSKKVELTPTDVKELKSLSAEAKKVEAFSTEAKEVDDIIKKIVSKEDITKKDIRKLSAFSKKLEKEFGITKPRSPFRERLTEILEKREKEALRSLKSSKDIKFSGLGSKDLADLTIVGASKLDQAGKSFIKWSQAMRDEFGDAIEPQLKRLFKRSQVLLTSERQKVRASLRLNTELKKMLRNLEANTEITQTDLDTFSELLGKVDAFKDEKRFELLSQIQQFMNDLDRPTIGRRLSTTQIIAQLLNPKTIGRNIFGNELFFRLERLNKYVATPIDWAASKFTGNRSITFKKAGQGDFWEAWLRGAKYGFKGINLRGLTTQFDIGTGLTFKSKFNPLHWMERSLKASLQSFDFAGFNRGYNQFLGEQAELAIKNRNLVFSSPEAKTRFVEKFIKEADFEILGMADHSGKYLTFQDENLIARTFQNFKRDLNLGQDFGLGDFILKYPRTPANLLYRALEYSPAGYARSIAILAKPFDSKIFKQREFINAFSRATTGTIGLTGLGAFLFQKGVMSGLEQKFGKVESFLAEQTGERNFQVNVSAISRWLWGGLKEKDLSKRKGDMLISYDWLQPVALSLAFGVSTAKSASLDNGVTDGVDDVAYEALNAALNTLVEQPLLKGIQDAFSESYNNDQLRRISKILANVPSSFTPTFLSQLRQFTDNERRISYDPNVLQKSINRVINKLPFVSQTLPRMYKTIGGEVAESYQNGNNTLFNVFFNPAFIGEYNIDPEIQLILDPFLNEKRKKQFPRKAPYTLRVTQGVLSRNGIKTDNAFEEFRLTGEDISEFQRRMSVALDKRITPSVIRGLKNRSPKEQEAFLAGDVSDVYEETREWFLKNRAKSYLNRK